MCNIYPKKTAVIIYVLRYRWWRQEFGRKSAMTKIDSSRLNGEVSKRLEHVLRMLKAGSNRIFM